ncbi:TPM domain-containing protein [Caloramator quimbayensis]|nr:TPM domain-containing protein [Caloramator quimbayensis]
MKGFKRIILSLLVFIIVLTSLAFGDTIFPNPADKKYINDYAGVISENVEDKIVEIGDELYRKTGAEVAAVIMENTDDVPIEDYATGLFRKWGIGSKDKNNGVLILVAFKNPSSLKKSRIEVGYGLEGALPDGKTGRIQDDYMIPYFKNGDYETGILKGYAAICSEVAKEYNINLTSLEGNGNIYKSRDVNINGVSVNPIVFIIFIIILFSLDGFFFRWAIFRIIMSILFGGRGGRGGFGGGGFGGFGGGSSGGGGSSRDW